MRDYHFDNDLLILIDFKKLKNINKFKSFFSELLKYLCSTEDRSFIKQVQRSVDVDVTDVRFQDSR